MTAPHRPRTIEERFFGHTTIVNVPVSIPPENLPEASTAPVDITPVVPDLIQSNNKAPSTLAKAGTFLSNHWGKILVGVIITGTVYWYIQKQMKKPKKNTVPEVAGLKEQDSTERSEKVVSRDERGRIIKTFDDYVYRVYDALGRLVECFGNLRTVDNNSNFRITIEYIDSVIVVKEYVFDDDNKDCVIADPMDYEMSKYYYRINGELYKREDYLKIIADGEKTFTHKLIETDNNPNGNPYVYVLPSYLK